MLTGDQVSSTLESIVEVQLPDGSIPWFAGGHTDPWDHVESAMALDVGGRRSEVERAYEWLVAAQRPDGALAFYYRDGEVTDERLDANHSAYLATGVWHHFLLSGDVGFAEAMWPTVERAVDFVLDLQNPGGEIIWMRMPDGTLGDYALLTSCSCLHLSLRCAIALAEHLGHERPDWELSLASLAHAVADRPDAFEPKQRFSMDWYYPVLGGVLTGPRARDRLAEQSKTFVVPGRGIRCVSDQPWVTAAETCEAAMAMSLSGLDREAESLFDWVQYLRHEDGSYWTGHNFVQDAHFPGGERTTWTAAAIILADEVLCGSGPTRELFSGEGLPVAIEPPSEPVVD